MTTPRETSNPYESLTPEEANFEFRDKIASIFDFLQHVTENVSENSSKVTKTSLASKIKCITKPLNAFVSFFGKEGQEEEETQENVEELHNDKEDARSEQKEEEEEEAATPEIQEPETVKPQTPPQKPEFNSLEDVFGSIGNFFSVTKENILKNSEKTIVAFQTGSWKNKKEAKKEEAEVEVEAHGSNDFIPTEEPKPISQTANKMTPEQEAEEKQRLQRIEEMRQMKLNYEANLKSLENELNALERLQKGQNTNLNKEPSEASLAMSRSVGSSKKMLPPVLQKDKKPSLAQIKMPSRVSQPSEEKMEKKEPLFMKMEREYVQQRVLPELERRKEQLKAKREFYRPMEQEDFKKHEEKYHESIQKELVHRQMEKLERENIYKKEQPHFYKSKALKKVMEYEKEEKEKDLQKMDEKKHMKEKMIQYGKLVKEMYFPKVETKHEPTSEDIIKEIIQKSTQAQTPLRAISVKDGAPITKEKPILPWKKKIGQDVKPKPGVQPVSNLMRHHHDVQERGRYSLGKSSAPNIPEQRISQKDWSQSPIRESSHRAKEETHADEHSKVDGPVVDHEYDHDVNPSADRHRVRGYKELLQRSREQKKVNAGKKPMDAVQSSKHKPAKLQSEQEEYGEDYEEQGDDNHHQQAHNNGEEEYEQEFEEQGDDQVKHKPFKVQANKPAEKVQMGASGHVIRKTNLAADHDRTKSTNMAGTNYRKQDKSTEKGPQFLGKDPEPNQRKYTNYLVEVKKKRAEETKKGAKVKYGQWDKVLKNENMNQYEKMVSVLDEVERIEYQARMKEKKLKSKEVPRNVEPVDLEEQVTDMYLESIKAKLALIQNMA